MLAGFHSAENVIEVAVIKQSMILCSYESYELKTIVPDKMCQVMK